MMGKPSLEPIVLLAGSLPIFLVHGALLMRKQEYQPPFVQRESLPMHLAEAHLAVGIVFLRYVKALL